MRDSFWMVTRRPRWDESVTSWLKAVRSSVDAAMGGVEELAFRGSLGWKISEAYL